jgi:hypothetical protein
MRISAATSIKLCLLFDRVLNPVSIWRFMITRKTEVDTNHMVGGFWLHPERPFAQR